MSQPVATLRPLTLDDLDTVVRWSRDQTFCRANGWDVGRPPAEVRRHWAQLIEDPPDHFLRFGAEVDGELVGYADLADIRRDEAELGFAVGDSSRWGTGIGTAAALAMITYGFQQVGLKQIRATVHEPNERSVAVLRKLGFRRVGTLPNTEEYLDEPALMIEFELRR